MTPVKGKKGVATSAAQREMLHSVQMTDTLARFEPRFRMLTFDSHLSLPHAWASVRASVRVRYVCLSCRRCGFNFRLLYPFLFFPQIC
jgi:hypothetical protein